MEEHDHNSMNKEMERTSVRLRLNIKQCSRGRKRKTKGKTTKIPKKRLTCPRRQPLVWWSFCFNSESRIKEQVGAWKGNKIFILKKKGNNRNLEIDCYQRQTYLKTTSSTCIYDQVWMQCLDRSIGYKGCGNRAHTINSWEIIGEIQNSETVYIVT